MTLYLKITSPKTWARGDFTSDTNLDINATIYREPQMTNVVDLTTYDTLTVRLLDANTQFLLFNTAQGVTGDANGILTWAVANGSAPYLTGHVKLRVRCEKSGEKITAVGVNGSDDLFFHQD